MSPWSHYVVVTGAGSPDINGVFELQEDVVHESCPVYGSLSGFSLSVCRSPDESGELKWGWIIGQGGAPAYGAMTEDKQVIPLTSWQCFEAAPPAPSLRLLDAEVAAAYVEEARERRSVSSASRPIEKAFRKAISLTKGWRPLASLHVELADFLLDLQRCDAAQQHVTEAQGLWPSCPEALRLKARLKAEALEWMDARLAAEQYQLVGGQSCSKLLEELGQGAVLHEDYFTDLGPETDATEMEELGPLREHITAVEVKGCSLSEINGLYEPSRAIANHREVFQNAFGFRLSLERLSKKTASHDSVDTGWVLGKGAVGFFGTTEMAENGLPSGGWVRFPAASATAPTQTTAQVVQLEEKILQVHKARLRSTSEPAACVAAAMACLKFLQRHRGSLWKMSFLLTELAGIFRQQHLHQRALTLISKALELCPSHWEAYLEAACIHQEMHQEAQASVALRQLLAARMDGRAAAMLLQLSNLKELDEWLRQHAEIPLVAEYWAKHHGNNLDLQVETSQAEKVVDETSAADFQLEDQREEVHAHWTLPAHIRSKDLQVQFRADWLQVQVKGQVLFDAELAHKIRPPDSSWTFSSPHFTVTLCKCPVGGKWPRWEVLQKEDAATRLERLGGLPFDQKDIRWM